MLLFFIHLVVSSELNISKSVVFELFSAPASLKIFKFLGEKHFYWKLNDFCTSEYFIEPTQLMAYQMFKNPSFICQISLLMCTYHILIKIKHNGNHYTVK